MLAAAARALPAPRHLSPGWRCVCHQVVADSSSLSPLASCSRAVTLVGLLLTHHAACRPRPSLPSALDAPGELNLEQVTAHIGTTVMPICIGPASYSGKDNAA